MEIDWAVEGMETRNGSNGRLELGDSPMILVGNRKPTPLYVRVRIRRFGEGMGTGTTAPQGFPGRSNGVDSVPYEHERPDREGGIPRGCSGEFVLPHQAPP